MITHKQVQQLIYTGWLSNADLRTVRRARELAYEHLDFKQVCAAICEVSHMINGKKQ